MHMKSAVAIALLAAAPLVSAHGAIIKATGDAGGQGMALGIDTSTPRDGTRRNPFQQDSTRFKGNQADTFGETVGAGDNSLEAGTKAIMTEMGTQLPQITPGGKVMMTVHQVNGDGGGPYTCEMDATGTGNNFQSVEVPVTVPGQNSRNRAGAMTDFPLEATVPANMKCTGTVAGQQNVCLVRCMNAARAGPFGGVVPVQMAGTSTPAQARRALAQAVKRSEDLLRKRAELTAEEMADGEEY